MLKLGCFFIPSLSFFLLLLQSFSPSVRFQVNCVHDWGHEEELTFGSPIEIEQLATATVIQFVKNLREQGNGQEDVPDIPDCKVGGINCWAGKENDISRKIASTAGLRRGNRPGEYAERADPAAPGLPALTRTKDVFAREELLMLAGPEFGGLSDSSTMDKRSKVIQESQTDGSISELSVEMHNYLESLQVMEAVAEGAIVEAEALQLRNLSAAIKRAENHVHTHYKLRNAFHLRDPLDGTWQMALEGRESNRSAAAAPGSARLREFRPNATLEEEFRAWFAAGGGRLRYAEAGRDGAGQPVRLLAREALAAGDVVVEVPLKLTLCRQTLRLVKTPDGTLKKYFDRVFDVNEEWGLAAFLAHQQTNLQRKYSHPGRGSRFEPFLRHLLRMRVPSRRVMEELEGTYAQELYRQWEMESTYMLSFLQFTAGAACGTFDPYHVCNGVLTRHVLRWALWVVRQAAVPVRKVTTGKPFLALVPFLHLTGHRAAHHRPPRRAPPGGGDGGGGGGGGEGGRGRALGEVALHLDNTLRFAAGEDAPAGSVMEIEKGNFTDCETFFRYHELETSSVENPHNYIHLALPGVTTQYDGLIQNLRRMQDWREMLRYPPSQIDLWIASNTLMMYGDETDGDEQEILEKLNAVFEGSNIQVGSQEEYLMLLGGAADAAEAALVLAGDAGGLARLREGRRGGGGAGGQAAMLYSAAESEQEGDKIDQAYDALSYALFQYQDALVAPRDPAAAGGAPSAVEKVLNRTQDFFVHGVRPLRGLDEVDKVMKRMKQLLDLCGPSKEQQIKHGNITDGLFCAMRVHLLGEGDLDTLCPAGPAPFHDAECNCLGRYAAHGQVGQCAKFEIYFNASLPISRVNEEKAVSAFISTLQGLQASYKSTIDQDESMLLLSTFREQNPMQAAAVYIRLKERLLVRDVLNEMYERYDSLDDLPYQVEEMQQRREQHQKNEAERKAANAKLREEMDKPKLLVKVPIQISGQTQNMSVYEGDDLELMVKQFVINHSLQPFAEQAILNDIKQKLPRQPPIVFTFPLLDPYGYERVIPVYEGKNGTKAVQDGCIAYNMSDSIEEDDCRNMIAKFEREYEKRMKLKVVLRLPLELPDGRAAALEVREGDAHDPALFVRARVDAYRISRGFVEGIQNQLMSRLPREIASMPVQVPSGRTIQFSFREGEDADAAAQLFCDLYGLPGENAPLLRQRLLQRVHPHVRHVAEGKPRREGQGGRGGAGEDAVV